MTEEKITSLLPFRDKRRRGHAGLGSAALSLCSTTGDNMHARPLQPKEERRRGEAGGENEAIEIAPPCLSLFLSFFLSLPLSLSLSFLLYHKRRRPKNIAITSALPCAPECFLHSLWQRESGTEMDQFAPSLFPFRPLLSSLPLSSLLLPAHARIALLSSSPTTCALLLSPSRL